MATKNARHRRPARKLRAPGRVFTREERRVALLRHLELLAADDGYGIPFASDDAPADRVALDTVTACLLASDRRERLRHRNSVLDDVKTGYEAVLAWAKEDPSAIQSGLEQRVQEYVDRKQFAPTDKELDHLAVYLEGGGEGPVLREKAGPGPKETAKKALAKAIGLSEGTLAEARRRAGPPLRLTRGRWIGLGDLRSLVLQVILGAAQGPQRLPLHALKELTPDTGRQLDAVYWAQMREMVADPSFLVNLAQLKTPPEWAVPLLEPFLANVESQYLVCRLVTALHLHLPSRLDVIADALPVLQAREREWATAMVLADIAGRSPEKFNENFTVEELETALCWEIQSRLSGEAAREWTACLDAACGEPSDITSSSTSALRSFDRLG